MVSQPHGGRLVRRVAHGRRRERLLEEAQGMPQLELDDTRAADVANIAHGAYSPLEGFLTEEDYESVLLHMRLSNDLPWPIPIVLDTPSEAARDWGVGDEIALTHRGRMLAVMSVEDIYAWDRAEYAERVYRTTDPGHPGVAKLGEMGGLLVGGRLELLEEPPEPFQALRLWPIETRVLFRERGWRTIVAFQTRNVPHLGHEYVQKAALTFTDGLLIHPLVGWKKPGDFRDEVIIRAYEELIRHYYPPNSVVLSVLRMQMRYAGPREAVFHAIVRKNYGATHFIVGRDHAGVGSYYGPYEAWDIFREFPDLGITPLFIRESFYCTKCGGMVNEKICPHGDEHRIRISGTKLRSLLANKQMPPETMMRREVAQVVMEFDNPFTE